MFWLLVVAGTIGVISPSGNEVGPFLSIEQAALSHVVTDRTRTDVFAWYTLDRLAGDRARRAGRRAPSHACCRTQDGDRVSSYRMVVMLYAALGRGAGVLVLSTVAGGRGGATRADSVRRGRRSPACPASTDRAMSW